MVNELVKELQNSINFCKRIKSSYKNQISIETFNSGLDLIEDSFLRLKRELKKEWKVEIDE
jgi:hypothetical protein